MAIIKIIKRKSKNNKFLLKAKGGGNKMYDSLKHWGIPGMKWGVRRYQNPDGTLTELGKKRYREYGIDKSKLYNPKVLYNYTGNVSGFHSGLLNNARYLRSIGEMKKLAKSNKNFSKGKFGEEYYNSPIAGSDFEEAKKAGVKFIQSAGLDKASYLHVNNKSDIDKFLKKYFISPKRAKETTYIEFDVDDTKKKTNI